ncbi:MAG: type II secretion system protein GspG [Pseudobdellovibrionaceae bacterium]|nr:type II secretion system protein GspG [Pseudobdellovibrionaceae bacterium]
MIKKLKQTFARPFGHHSEQGMTIIEILIVIALMSTIMAVLVTKLLDKSDSAKADLTGVLQSKLDESLTMYKLDTARYPTTEDGLHALIEAPTSARNWRGPYTEAEKLNDTWGNPLQYELINARKFKLISAGIDAEFGTEDDIIFPKEKAKPVEEAPVTADLTIPEGNLNKGNE